jgi:predicted RNase H-like HicB family nuclease
VGSIPAEGVPECMRILKTSTPYNGVEVFLRMKWRQLYVADNRIKYLAGMVGLFNPSIAAGYKTHAKEFYKLLLSDKYTAVFYYEWHPEKEGIYQIAVCFPDLFEIGLPAYTVGNDPDDAVAAAKDVLALVLEHAAEEGIELPNPSLIDKVNIDRGSEYTDYSPFRIEIIEVTTEIGSSST